MNTKFTLVKESLLFTDNALICVGKNEEQRTKLERNMLISIRKLLEEHPNCLEDASILESLKREANVKNAKFNFLNYYHYTSSITFAYGGVDSNIIRGAKIGSYKLLEDMLNHVEIEEIPILIDDFRKEQGTVLERIRRFYFYRKNFQDIVCDTISVTSIKGYFPVTEVYPVHKKVYSLGEKRG